MLINPLWFLPSIIAYALFYFLFILDQKYVLPHWVVRKLIHSVGMLLIGIFILIIKSLIDVIITLTIFLFLLFIFAIIPPHLTQYLFLKSKRNEEKLLETIINVTITSTSLIVLYLVFQYQLFYFISGMYVLAIGDTFGEFFGRKYGKHKYTSLFARIFKIDRQKSIEGSIAVFSGSFFGLILALIVYDYRSLILLLSPMILISFLIASLFAALLESISISLLDNILLPWGIALLFYFCRCI